LNPTDVSSINAHTSRVAVKRFDEKGGENIQGGGDKKVEEQEG